MNQIIPFKKEITFKTMIGKITSIALEHNLKINEDSTINGDFLISGTYKMTEASQIDEDFSYKVPIEITIDDKYITDNITLDIDDFTYEVVDEERLSVNISLLIDNLELREVEDEIDIIEEVQEKVEVDTLKEFDEVLEEIEDFSKSDDVELLLRESNDSDFDLDSEDLFLETDEEVKLEIPEDNVEINEFVNKEINPTPMPYFTNEPINPQPVNNVVEEDESSSTAGESVSSIFNAFSNTEETFKAYSIYIVRDGDNVDDILERYQTTRENLSEYNDLSDIRLGSKIIIPATNE